MNGDRRWLGVILAGYLVLALAYNLATPFTKPPDEGPHADYIRYLVEHHRFPVLDEHAPTYEAHQPPLYYLLAAPVWAAAGAMSHDPSGTAQALAVRIMTTLIGGLGLVLIWGLARVLYRSDPGLAPAATAFAAFLPMHVALAASVSNDMLLEVLFTASLLVIALLIRQGYSHRRALALGAAMGAALLTKATGILLLPVALVGIMLASRVREPAAMATGKKARDRALAAPPPPAQLDARAFFGGCALAFGVAALLAGPWLLRNRVLYGDFLAQGVFESYFKTHHPAPLREQFLQGGVTNGQYWLRYVLPYTFDSFWGVFGPMTIPMPGAVYTALVVPSVLAVAGAAIHLMRGREVLDETQRATWLTLWLCLFLVVSGFLRFNTVFFQAQGRYLTPAMAPIVLLMVVGWFVFVPPRARTGATAGLGIAMAALSVYALVGVIVPFFQAGR